MRLIRPFIGVLLGVALVTSAALAAPASAAADEPWALSMDQRRAYLEYYAPIIMKKADEGGGWAGTDGGRDWMSNFDFDNDQRFGNNKENWEDLNDYLSGDRPDWDISPTMYTAMLEYTTAAGKGATLIYYAYHAKQRTSIHDWERIEIRVEDITGDPGTGERVDHVVITEHSKHNTRPAGHEDLNFMPTATGQHVMIWRADQTSEIQILKPNRPVLGELHYVEESWVEVEELAGSPNDTAKVDINGHDEKGFHYVFVPETDVEAVQFWDAGQLTDRTADSLASHKGTGSVDVEDVKKVQYELQDLADVAATFWDGGLADRHWDGDVRNILIHQPIPGGIDGGPEVPVGVQEFQARSIDSEDSKEDRKGFINKHWFWGTYLLGCGGNGKIEDGLDALDASGSFTGEAYREGAPNGTRMIANGQPDSAGAYWDQHDYFLHDGEKAKCDGSGELENGEWLPAGWHLDVNGGFDGRWVQLFDDGG